MPLFSEKLNFCKSFFKLKISLKVKRNIYGQNIQQYEKIILNIIFIFEGMRKKIH